MEADYQNYQEHLDKCFCDSCNKWVEPISGEDQFGDESEICPECGAKIS